MKPLTLWIIVDHRGNSYESTLKSNRHESIHAFLLSTETMKDWIRLRDVCGYRCIKVLITEAPR